jgi:predicted transcriptional regulator
MQDSTNGDIYSLNNPDMKNFVQRMPEVQKPGLDLKAPSVTRYMATDLITFRTGTPIHQVVDQLLHNRITGAPVMDERGSVVGMIDDKTCLKLLFSGAYYNHPVEQENVGAYMDDIMKFITEEEDIFDVACIFRNSTYKRLLVVNTEGNLIGQISRRDVIRAIQEMKPNTW